MVGTVQGFAAQRGLEAMPTVQLIEHIQDKLGFTVIVDKTGNYRVDMPYQNSDEIEYKRGSKDSVERNKEHEFGTCALEKARADEKFASKKGKLALACGVVKLAGDLESRVSK